MAELEKLIAYHCAPALAGIKPANIVSCSKKDFPNVMEDVRELAEQMGKKGICFEIVCECEKRVLLMVYRQDRLGHCLEQREILSFLRSYGYPSEFSLPAYLAFLKNRLAGESFPHEIGAFLGYPLGDILGFINNESCLLVGEWKVYSNPDGARAIFKRYNMCKCALLKRVSAGKTLAELFAA